MPPKVRVTREQILDAAFQIVKEQGHEALTIRAAADCLGCSTQPILYNFRTAEELKEAVYQKADQFHSACLMNIKGLESSPLLEIGLNYIRFGAEEPELFRFLFQTDRFSGAGLDELLAASELSGLLEMTAGALGDPARAAEQFRRMFLMAHGYAAMFANNAMEYREHICREDLQSLFP